MGTNALIASGEARALVSADALLEALALPAQAVTSSPLDPILEALAAALSTPTRCDGVCARPRASSRTVC